ncbi:protein of unknown function DUF1376 [Rhodobacter sphaeroides ATCC 17029]|nr:protein of unknown function DUF1376 [Cereibacter sphaeroides ATCC 17029]
MSDRPFMKLWISDFLSDTLDLDAREVGAYLLLLMAMWKAGGTLSSDEGKLRRMARCGRDWPRVWAGISHHFEEVDGRLTNRRLARELSEAVTKQEVNRQSGALGGKAKALKDKEARLANAIASQSQSQKEYSDTSYRPPSAASEGSDRDQDQGRSEPSIFSVGVAFLTGRGVDERRARSVIGAWRKAGHSDPEILAAFDECSRAGAVEPVAWLNASFDRKPESSVDLKTIFAQIRAEREDESE